MLMLSADGSEVKGFQTEKLAILAHYSIYIKGDRFYILYVHLYLLIVYVTPIKRPSLNAAL